MLLVALGVYAGGAVMCALSPSLFLLTLARLIQGFGGGGLIALSVALIAEVVPPRERGRFQAYIAGVFAVASGLGPLAGGVLTQFLGWRAVFMLQPPLALLAAIMAIRRLGNAHPGVSRGFSFDWAGLGLFALFVGPALLALDQARRLDASGLGLALALAALAAGALFLLWQWERRAPDPLLPLALLGEASIWRANLLSAMVAGAFVGSIAFLPIYFVAVRGLTPSGAGLALLPLAATAAFGAMLVGRLFARTGRTMRWAGIGLTCSALLLLAAVLGMGRMPLWAFSAMLGLVSFGFGCSFPMVQVTVQLAAPRERLGSATASVQFTRALGSATGTALMGAVLFGSLVLQGGGAAALFVDLVNHGAPALAGLDAAAQVAFRAQMVAAFQAAFLTAALLVSGAAWLTTRVPLRQA
jgi:predicted MFS family arabinose efflux permease